MRDFNLVKPWSGNGSGEDTGLVGFQLGEDTGVGWHAWIRFGVTPVFWQGLNYKCTESSTAMKVAE